MGLFKMRALAKHYNDYFLDSVLDLAETFSEVNCCGDDHGDGNVSHCRLQNVNEDTISKIISNLKNSKAKDIFGIDTSLLKEHITILTPVLTIAVNQYKGKPFSFGIKKSSSQADFQVRRQALCVKLSIY